ncbi:MAG TPA: hypothetical protein VJ934_04085, partial [Desulfomicrobiaceae bacterium]|nr:hypothetical protein [Desulfomicrobiaceae bacterium]
MPPTLPRWLFREHSQSGFDQPSLSPDELEPLSEELGISALLASILNARGFRSRTAMDTFLSP